MDLLPTEICIRILNELPVVEHGARSLARCGMTGKCTLRNASLEPVLWKPHYEYRYVHSEHSKEVERRRNLEGNWREMYKERRRLDCVVLHSLKMLECCEPRARAEHARRVVSFGMDVWDALSDEADGPPPPLFQKDEDIRKVKDGSPLRNLTRKYWASELLKIITRRSAINRWIGLKQYNAGEGIRLVPFEEAFASLSSFHGILPDQIVAQLDREAEGCRRYLEDGGISYDSGTENFRTGALSNAVCTYMCSRGFRKANQTGFYNFRNSLPHLFMTTYGHTLPLPLVFLYVAIMKRLGLEASPLNTPNVVTALVRDAVVDVSRSGQMDSIIALVENYEEVKHIFSASNQAVITAQLLARAARNIEVAGIFEYGKGIPDHLHENHDIFIWLQAKYLSQCLLAIFRSEPVDDGGPILAAVERNFFPLDMELVVQDQMLQFFPTHGDFDYNDDDEDDGRTLETDPRYGSQCVDVNCLFVGQIVSVENLTLQCITGWKKKDRQILCSTIAQCHHRINDFPISAVTPAVCTAHDLTSFLQNPMLGQYFENAEFREMSVGSGRGRGRFIMNQYLMRLYPNEEARGAHWVRGEA